jgi:hypothetical protein
MFGCGSDGFGKTSRSLHALFSDHVIPVTPTANVEVRLAAPTQSVPVLPTEELAWPEISCGVLDILYELSMPFMVAEN